MPLKIIHNDITNMETDAIVNAANCQLLSGGGVCGAIFQKAGYKELTHECQSLSPIAVGHAVITKGYHLKAKYVIHAVGPIYQDGHHHEKQDLINAYHNALKLAVQYHLKSISFPLISSGIYGYPKEEALEVATQTISHFLLNHDMDVYLVVFDRKAIQISEKLYSDIEHYIDLYYEEVNDRRYRAIEFNSSKSVSYQKLSLDDLLEETEETFSETLLRLIDEKGMKDVDVYKRANMDRKLFSKIRSHKDYHPKKKTVLSLAIALRLSLEETQDLLNKAGYSLSHSQKEDIVIEYFIEKEEFDLFEINNTLFSFDLPLLS